MRTWKYVQAELALDDHSHECDPFYYINYEQVKNSGYQSMEIARSTLYCIGKTYSRQQFQLLEEKPTKQPLYHSQKVKNLMKNEQESYVCQCYMANQSCPKVGDTRNCSMQNELYHQSFNAKELKRIGSLSCYGMFEIYILGYIHYNCLRMYNIIIHWLVYDYDKHFTFSELLLMLELINSSLKPTFIDEAFQKDGYFCLDNIEKEEMKTIAREWVLKFNIAPKNASWNEDFYMFIHLYMYAYGYNQEETVPIDLKDDLLKLFYNKFDWKLIKECCRKAGYEFKDK